MIYFLLEDHDRTISELNVQLSLESEQSNEYRSKLEANLADFDVDLKKRLGEK